MMFSSSESFNSEEIYSDGIKILVVDDDKEVHSVVKLVLNGFKYGGESLFILNAYSAKEAKEILSREDDIALILLDVVMESEDSGLKLVKFIREVLGNRLTRIVISTGQPGLAPELEVIKNYDINDYKAKTEFTSHRLYTTITASIRSYKDLKTIEQSKIELQKKDRLNDLMLNSLPCVALLVDGSGNLTKINKPAREVDINISTHFIDFNNPKTDKWGEFPEHFSPLVDTEWESNVDERYYQHYWSRVDEVNYLYTIFDITEKRRYQRMFIHSQRMKSIGLLASGLAHDFNNILTTIIGFSNILQKRLESGSSEEEMVANILRAGRNGSSLAKTLLSLGKDKVEEFKQVVLHDVIDRAITLLTPNCSEVEITKIYTNQSSIIRGDINLLENLFINLGLNARDAMGGKGSLKFKTSSVVIDSNHPMVKELRISAGQYIKIEVGDTGSGIEEEIVEKIFDPLFTTKEENGSGLGLASVYNSVELHQGVITVDTELGIGTTFSILLPAYYQ